MVTSFLRMQATSSDVAFQALIELIEDPITEIDAYPTAITALFKEMLTPGEFLIFPSSKLANWLVPESTEGQLADFFDIEAGNHEKLWDNEKNEWKYHSILAFAQIDYDFCALQVNMEQGSLALTVFCSAYELSRFWDANAQISLDDETSEHFATFCDSMASWLTAYSSEHFRASGRASLNFVQTAEPQLELIKHVFRSGTLFPDFCWSEISNFQILADQLREYTQLRRELAAIVAEDDAEELEAEQGSNKGKKSGRKHRHQFNEQSHKTTVIRPVELEKTTGFPKYIACDTVFSPSRECKRLVKKYIKHDSAQSNIPLLTLFLCEEGLMSVEIVYAALSMGFNFSAVKSKSKKKHSTKYLAGITKAEQQMQHYLGFSDGRTRTGGKNGLEYSRANPERMSFKREVIERESSRDPALVWSLTDFGRNKARILLGLKKFTFCRSEATLLNPMELLFRILIDNGKMNAKQLEKIWIETEVVDEYEQKKKSGRSMVAAIRAAKVQRFIKTTPNSKGNVYRVRRDRVEMIEDSTPQHEIFDQELMSAIRDALEIGFNQRPLMTFGECLFYMPESIADPDHTLLRAALTSLVADSHLYCLLNNSSPTHTIYVIRGEDNLSYLSFEYFYKMFNQVILSAETRINYALHRATVKSAFSTGEVMTNLEVMTTMELITAFDTDPEVAAVSVHENKGTMEFLGKGLFANQDLPADLLIPVVGTTVQDTSLPADLFLPYGFKFQSYLGERQTYVVDARPDPNGPVTCWAGFVNDPKGTCFEVNAEPVCSFFEDKMYLKLCREVKAGEQLFWDYGEEYWTAHKHQPLPEQQQQQHQPEEQQDYSDLGDRFQEIFGSLDSLNFDRHPFQPILEGSMSNMFQGDFETF